MAAECYDVRLVPKKLEMPLFLLSRVRIKQHSLEPMRRYIARKSVSYTKRCSEEYATESKSSNKIADLLGLADDPSPPCPTQRPLRTNRDLIAARPWQLPPNLYDLQRPHKRLEDGRKPLSTKCKLGPSQSKKGSTETWKFYDTNQNFEHCSGRKGIFLTNARDRKATARSMVTSPTECYRNPADPGPGYYNPENYLKKKILWINTQNQAPNPHRFAPHSSVPDHPSPLFPRNISFLPGPGRFETGHDIGCSCRSGLIFMPGLHMKIEVEKRKKFRRLPYTKIKARKYCSPDWSHVVGHGFRYLFRQPPRMRPRAKSPQAQTGQKKTQREYQLYPDARYISMINSPTRSTFTWHMARPESRPLRIRFNTNPRHVTRRHLETSRKIAFSSGQDRFKDHGPPAPLTISQLAELTLLLPLDRQLRDHPVMRVQPDDVQPKYLEPTRRMQDDTKQHFRKPMFKFLPLSRPKPLANKEDIRPKTTKGFYSSGYDPAIFFRDELSKSFVASIAK